MEDIGRRMWRAVEPETMALQLRRICQSVVLLGKNGVANTFILFSRLRLTSVALELEIATRRVREVMLEELRSW